jgi:hypothetical protein
MSLPLLRNAVKIGYSFLTVLVVSCRARQFRYYIQLVKTGKTVGWESVGRERADIKQGQSRSPALVMVDAAVVFYE